MWSPRGDLIAFAKTSHGQFYIGLMKQDGSGERLITGGYLVEAPCWASNGRYIAYSCEGGPKQKAKIGVVDITGNHTRLIETRGDAMYPAWSPKLAVKIK
jgi:TolB protein